MIRIPIRVSWREMRHTYTEEKVMGRQRQRME